MLVDSHCHLSFKELGEYTQNTSNILDLAKKENIVAFLDIVLNKNILPTALNFSKDKNNVFHAFGIHPLYINNQENAWFNKQDLMQTINSSPKIIALGETGLDYHLENTTNQPSQQNNFHIHCEVASELNLPIIIHTRCALDDTIAILKEHVNSGSLTGVIHCFTEDIKAAKNFLDLGFYISFSGIVTFKNATAIQEAAKFVPLDKLLVETDSPYLAPVPFRGKCNQPNYVKHVAEYIAMLKNTEFSEIANHTTNNFKKLFKVEV
ncbi:TatD family hydrolase [Rickettsiales bacterium LUAb2]